MPNTTLDTQGGFARYLLGAGRISPLRRALHAALAAGRLDLEGVETSAELLAALERAPRRLRGDEKILDALFHAWEEYRVAERPSVARERRPRHPRPVARAEKKVEAAQAYLEKIRAYLETPYLGTDLRKYRRNQVARFELWTEALGQPRETLRSSAQALTLVMEQFSEWRLVPTQQLHLGEICNVYRRKSMLTGRPSPLNTVFRGAQPSIDLKGQM